MRADKNYFASTPINLDLYTKSFSLSFNYYSYRYTYFL